MTLWTGRRGPPSPARAHLEGGKEARYCDDTRRSTLKH